VPCMCQEELYWSFKNNTKPQQNNNTFIYFIFMFVYMKC
jgi:hypothetical protein